MTKVESNDASLKLNKELLSLNQSALISLYTIDITDIFLENIASTASTNFNQTIFRFHNEAKALDGRTTTSIWFQNNEFIAAPIQVEGFETSTKGTLPIPKLSITVDDTNIYTLSLLKEKIFQLGDLTGARVIRQRTFAKFLDEKNFPVLPNGFTPDPNVEFGRDIFYIERKSLENKYILEFELSSNFDIQGIKLPNRIVSANKCLSQYRGEGCNYEYKDLKTSIHGDAILPDEAPPTFNVNDENIEDIINTKLNIRFAYDQTVFYKKGDTIYLERDGLKYWFVCKVDNPLLGPPNANYWITDQCGKNINSCRKRWNLLTRNNIKSPFPPKCFPFGGFPGVRKVQEIN